LASMAAAFSPYGGIGIETPYGSPFTPFTGYGSPFGGISGVTPYMPSSYGSPFGVNTGIGGVTPYMPSSYGSPFGLGSHGINTGIPTSPLTQVYDVDRDGIITINDFHICDLNKDGFLTPEELIQVVKMTLGQNMGGYMPQLQQLVSQTLLLTDKNGDNRVSVEEFCEEPWMNVDYRVFDVDHDGLVDIGDFRICDMDKDGLLTPEELIHVLQTTIGQPQLIRQIVYKTIVLADDEQKDGRLSIEEFCGHPLTTVYDNIPFNTFPGTTPQIDGGMFGGMVSTPRGFDPRFQSPAIRRGGIRYPGSFSLGL